MKCEASILKIPKWFPHFLSLLFTSPNRFCVSFAVTNAGAYYLALHLRVCFFSELLQIDIFGRTDILK